MTIREDQNKFLSEKYAEAIRYMDNAKETLRKAGKDDPNYTDPKYVKTACGTAYSGVLVAIDAWFILKGIPELSRKQRKSVDCYTACIVMIDENLASSLLAAYGVLHRAGYYDGITSVKVIEGGFDAAYEIIERIKPEHFVPVRETRAQGIKRGLNNLLISTSVMFRLRRII